MCHGEAMIRLLKFIFIVAPCVTVYFFSLLVVLMALSDAEGGRVGVLLLALSIAVLAVLATTWAAGFWGRWWFPATFMVLPFVVFVDFILSSILGIPPMVLTVCCFVVTSVIGSMKRVGT